MYQAPLKVKLLSFSLNKTTEQSMKLKDVNFQCHERGESRPRRFLATSGVIQTVIQNTAGNLADQGLHDC